MFEFGIFMVAAGCAAILIVLFMALDCGGPGAGGYGGSGGTGYGSGDAALFIATLSA